MASTLNNPSEFLAPESPASQTCLEDESEDESEDDSSIEYFPRQTKSKPQKYLDDGMKWQDIIRQGLPELVEDAGLGAPKIALAGSAPVFVWMTTTETFIALPELVESALRLVAYQHPHQYNVSDTISLLSLSDAASLAIQLARNSPKGPYEDVFLTLQALVRQELLFTSTARALLG
jgi:hypothetical protein